MGAPNRKDRFYFRLNLILEAIKYNGLFDGLAVVFHYVNVALRTKQFHRKKQFRLFGLTFHFLNPGSVFLLLAELFAGGVYFFRSGRRDPIIFDVGANVGDSLLYFKHLYPEARVYAFEPVILAFDLLKKNAEANGFRDVHLFNEALSDRNGTMELNVEDSGMFVLSSPWKQQAAQRRFDDSTKRFHPESQTVSVRCFSDRFQEAGVDRLDLLKIDIEGGEGRLMEDVRPFLDRIDHIIMEYHLVGDQVGNSFDAIVSMLRAAGFAIRIVGAYRHFPDGPDPNYFYITAQR